MLLWNLLSAVLAHQVVNVFSSTQCGFRYVENPEIEGVCCNPYFDCPPGHEIVRCTKSFTNDTCRPCAKGSVQPDVISSFDEPKITKCFVKKRECYARDSTYSRENENGCAGKNGCKCARNKCYFDDFCVCTSISPCGINKELDPVKKACVPCGEFRYKPTIGCAPCRMNTTAWRIAMDRKSSVFTSPSQVTSRSSSSTTYKPTIATSKNTEIHVSVGVSTVTNSTVSVGPVLSDNPDKGVNIQIILGILIPLLILAIIVGVVLYIRCRRNPQRGKLVCFKFKLFKRRNEGRELGNGHVVRYDPVLPDIERNGNLHRERNNVINSSVSSFHPIDSVPHQIPPQCNHYAPDEIVTPPQDNRVVPDHNESLTPPQSNDFVQDQTDSTPLMQHSNQPLKVRIAPQNSNSFTSSQTPTPRTSFTDDTSAKIATPTDHDSHSEMVPSASPFQLNTTNHPLSGATYDGTRKKEVASVAPVSPGESKVNVVKPFVKYDSGCFSTATEVLSSAAQSNNFPIRRQPQEGENDTEVKRQPDSHESRDDENNSRENKDDENKK